MVGLLLVGALWNQQFFTVLLVCQAMQLPVRNPQCFHQMTTVAIRVLPGQNPVGIGLLHPHGFLSPPLDFPLPTDGGKALAALAVDSLSALAPRALNERGRDQIPLLMAGAELPESGHQADLAALSRFHERPSQLPDPDE